MASLIVCGRNDDWLDLLGCDVCSMTGGFQLVGGEGHTTLNKMGVSQVGFTSLFFFAFDRAVEDVVIS